MYTTRTNKQLNLQLERIDVFLHRNDGQYLDQGGREENKILRTLESCRVE